MKIEIHHITNKPTPPPLGHYGPDNRDLPNVSIGWHIFADGNMWCAVGPTFINPQESVAAFAYTPREAAALLKVTLKANDAFARVKKPEFSDFHVHMPTVKPND